MVDALNSRRIMKNLLDVVLKFSQSMLGQTGRR
jgi:hypothetical protein